eukprot:364313-Chlamydomonas_euryale.AAC.7
MSRGPCSHLAQHVSRDLHVSMPATPKRLQYVTAAMATFESTFENLTRQPGCRPRTMCCCWLPNAPNPLRRSVWATAGAARWMATARPAAVKATTSRALGPSATATATARTTPTMTLTQASASAKALCTAPTLPAQRG